MPMYGSADADVVDFGSIVSAFIFCYCDTVTDEKASVMWYNCSADMEATECS